ncbi:hypothetical protein ACB098_03G017600 [Castanea mollissima]
MKVLCLRAYEPDKTVQALSSFSKQAILGPSFNFVNFITDPNPSITGTSNYQKKEKKRAGTSDCRIANRARRLCSKNDKVALSDCCRCSASRFPVALSDCRRCSASRFLGVWFKENMVEHIGDIPSVYNWERAG